MPGRKIALAAPRGFAKSTLLSFLLPMWAICLDLRHFIPLISNTYSQAIKFLHAIKHEFETNERLQTNFPHLRPNEKKWSEDEVELFNGDQLSYKLMAMGSEAQLRGLKFLQYRPDLIPIDDGENDEMVRSGERRQNFEHWMDHVVLQTNPHAWIVMIGTIMGEAALLWRIVATPELEDQRKYGDWQTARYQALLDAHTPEERSAWPEHQATPDLQAERVRDPLGFAQEKQNEPVSPESRQFQPEWLIFQASPPVNPTYYMTVDPAISTKRTADFKAALTACTDEHNVLYLIRWINTRGELSEYYNAIIADYERFQHRKIGLEIVAAQKLLADQITQTAKDRGLYPPFEPLKTDTTKSKGYRIEALQPRFRAGGIVFVGSHDYWTPLLDQLLGYHGQDSLRHDDLLDCLAYLLQIIEPTWTTEVLDARVPEPWYADSAETAETVFHGTTGYGEDIGDWPTEMGY